MSLALMAHTLSLPGTNLTSVYLAHALFSSCLKQASNCFFQLLAPGSTMGLEMNVNAHSSYRSELVKKGTKGRKRVLVGKGGKEWESWRKEIFDRPSFLRKTSFLAILHQRNEITLFKWQAFRKGSPTICPCLKKTKKKEDGNWWERLESSRTCLHLRFRQGFCSSYMHIIPHDKIAAWHHCFFISNINNICNFYNFRTLKIWKWISAI